MDNINTRILASFREALAPAEARRPVANLEVMHTTKQVGWSSVADVDMAVPEKRCTRGRCPTAPPWSHTQKARQESRNHTHAKVDWQFTTANP